LYLSRIFELRVNLLQLVYSLLQAVLEEGVFRSLLFQQVLGRVDFEGKEEKLNFLYDWMSRS
jgi:hypothetical protein